MSVALLFFGVQEPKRHQIEKRGNPISQDNLRQLDRRYWWVVSIGAIFTLARFSEAFLVLRAQQCGVPIAFAPLIMVAMNLAYAATAYPFGKVSDKMQHTVLLSLGLGVLIAADLLLAVSTNWLVLLGGVVLWGIHMGATQGLLATMVADNTPAHLRGTAFGFFNLMSGLAMLIASTLAGALWSWVGASKTFQAGAVFCAMALLGLFLQPRQQP
jgi:MFS family permease